MKQQLTAAKVFSSMAVFDILRGQFHLTFHTLAQAAAGKVSLDRVEDYLFKVCVLSLSCISNFPHQPMMYLSPVD